MASAPVLFITAIRHVIIVVWTENKPVKVQLSVHRDLKYHLHGSGWSVVPTLPDALIKRLRWRSTPRCCCLPGSQMPDCPHWVCLLFFQLDCLT